MLAVSVILPAFNERENILALIEEVARGLQGLDHEILVVDDNSPDGTAQAVAARAFPGVRLIVRRDMRGYARSIRRGIEEARGDLLVLMDSDFNHLPRYIPAMLEALRTHDAVSASRFLPGGRMVPAWRGACSWCFNGFIRVMTGSRMTDNLYGFFAVKREALMRCPFDEIFTGFGDYGIRLLFHLQKNGARVHEFPAVYGLRRHGTGRRQFFSMLWQYARATWQLTRKGRI